MAPSHEFGLDHSSGKKKTILVLWFTAVTMVVEIAAGTFFGSMALLADGWHMATHVAAFAITLFAYRFADKHKTNPKYSFSTGKVGVLGGFASAVALITVAVMMAMESIHRLLSPESIRFNEAIGVAVLGLMVNVISAVLLRDHGHIHDHHDLNRHQDTPHKHHSHSSTGGHHDHNLRAAYFHVLADLLTSVLAVTALTIGKFLGWNWPDAVMGIVGAIIITKWGIGLIRETSGVLLDTELPAHKTRKIKDAVESVGPHKIVDFHTWRVSPKHSVAVMTVLTHKLHPPEYFKALIASVYVFDHITVEVALCEKKECKE